MRKSSPGDAARKVRLEVLGLTSGLRLAALLLLLSAPALAADPGGNSPDPPTVSPLPPPHQLLPDREPRRPPVPARWEARKRHEALLDLMKPVRRCLERQLSTPGTEPGQLTPPGPLELEVDARGTITAASIEPRDLPETLRRCIEQALVGQSATGLAPAGSRVRLTFPLMTDAVTEQVAPPAEPSTPTPATPAPEGAPPGEERPSATEQTQTCEPLPRASTPCTTPHMRCPIHCTDDCRPCSYLECREGQWQHGEEILPGP